MSTRNEKSEEFLRKFEGYVKKIDHAKYLHQHYHDQRNKDPVEDKIRLDTNSREAIQYLKALITMANEVRAEGGLEPV
jgi:hypothetical protein